MEGSGEEGAEWKECGVEGVQNVVGVEVEV